MEHNFKVAPSENGLPLLQFLAGRLAISRRKAKEIIDQRRVFVSGKRIWMARHTLKAGDSITGLLGLEQAAAEQPIKVLYKDKDYLVIDKPAGIEANGKNSVEQLLNRHSGDELSCDKATGSTGGATASGRAAAERDALALPRHWRGTRTFNGDFENQLIACHRLDKDTSGCLIFASNPAAKERIIPLFATGKIIKTYQAIIAGRLAEKSVTIARPLEGQRAVTHVEVISSVPAATHVRIKLETGRTHQIRKHLAAIGHPVLGDRQYGGNRALSPVERSIPRQMLHASEIAFVNPISGKSIRCRAELPEDFKDCLKRFNLK